MKRRYVPHRCLAVCIPRGICKLRNAPHSLDCGIAEQLLNRVHIGSLRCDADAQHLYAEQLAHGKVPVISRDDADEFYLSLSRPRRIPFADAEKHGAGQRIVHDIQTCRACHGSALTRSTAHIFKYACRLVQPLKLAVLARVGSVFG